MTETKTDKAYGVVSVPKGSWKWQERFGLAEYVRRTRKDGVEIWVRSNLLNNKLTPGARRALLVHGYNGQRVASYALQNMPTSDWSGGAQ